MEDEYGLGSFGRGAVGTVSGVAVMISVPFVGKFYDGQYRKDPSQALRFVGWLVLPSALLVPVQYFMPNPVGFAILAVPTAVMTVSAYAMVGPLLTSVIPYQLRGMGQALGALYIFFIGATGGALLAGLLSNAYGTRTAIIVLYVPSTIVGGLLILRSSIVHPRRLARWSSRELREEQDEHERRMADPDRSRRCRSARSTSPTARCRSCSTSASRSARARCSPCSARTVPASRRSCASSPGSAPRRAVSFGTTGAPSPTSPPEMRTRLGIRMLPGGKGVFNDLSIRENLEVAAYILRKDRAAMNDAIDGALAMFPELAERADVAGVGAVGRATADARPRRGAHHQDRDLIIDELSLGLAPIMVERLVKVIEQLREQGMTIIVVEQSLNVAMAIADRAVFLEKGHVRFQGDMKELAGRDDLARAVFLGTDGG